MDTIESLRAQNAELTAELARTLVELNNERRRLNKPRWVSVCPDPRSPYGHYCTDSLGRMFRVDPYGKFLQVPIPDPPDEDTPQQR